MSTTIEQPTIRWEYTLSVEVGCQSSTLPSFTNYGGDEDCDGVAFCRYPYSIAEKRGRVNVFLPDIRS